MTVAPASPPEAAPFTQRSFWSSVRELMAGSEQSFTEGPIRRPILLLAIPMAIEMGMQQVFGIVDMLFVARLGAAPTAVVGITEALLLLVVVIADGLANIINLALDPCLIFGWGPFPKMGVTGAALATTLGRSIGVAYQLWLLLRRGGRLRIGPEHLRLDGRRMLRLFRSSLGGIAQF